MQSPLESLYLTTRLLRRDWQQAVNTLPDVTIKAAQVMEQNLSCDFCYCNYKVGEEVKELPDCGHVFHECCIKASLLIERACPYCTTPIFTPTHADVQQLIRNVRNLSVQQNQERRQALRQREEAYDYAAATTGVQRPKVKKSTAETNTTIFNCRESNPVLKRLLAQRKATASDPSLQKTKFKPNIPQRRSHATQRSTSSPSQQKL